VIRHDDPCVHHEVPRVLDDLGPRPCNHRSRFVQMHHPTAYLAKETLATKRTNGDEEHVRGRVVVPWQAHRASRTHVGRVSRCLHRPPCRLCVTPASNPRRAHDAICTGQGRRRASPGLWRRPVICGHATVATPAPMGIRTRNHRRRVRPPRRHAAPPRGRRPAPGVGHGRRMASPLPGGAGLCDAVGPDRATRWGRIVRPPMIRGGDGGTRSRGGSPDAPTAWP
jgi:hypothetical protein